MRRSTHGWFRSEDAVKRSRVPVAIAAALALAACGDAAQSEPFMDGSPPILEPGQLVPLAERLPVEVLGPPGTVRGVRLAIAPQAFASGGPFQLRLALHNVVDLDSAELVVNGRGRFDLEGAFVRPSGGYAEGEVELAAAMLQPGDNDFVFRYTRQVPDVSGYRVLAIELLQDGERTAGLDDWDDPASWTPVRGDPDTIAAGQRFFQDESRDGGPTCARCHARSGADLEYYALSNESIIARAMFHEFSREDAEAIASYIRTLEVPREGRPYRPPFQPGADNLGAAGAGLGALLADDAAFAQAAFGAPDLPPALDWEWAAGVDAFLVPTTIQLPTWFRWLPRTLDDAWFMMEGGALAAAEESLEADPTLESAHAFMQVAVDLGKQLMIRYGDHRARIELLRFAAVKLWDWSRRQGFYQPHHGFPDDAYGDQGHWGSPPYPYEVGFAFFEAEIAGQPHALAQAAEWWWAQIAVDPGRGRSNGSRPLNYADVLLAAEAIATDHEIAFLHLLGSWEESRGPMEQSFGQDIGPVRLLATPLLHLDGAAGATLLVRFMNEEQRWLDGGGLLSGEHRVLLEQAWNTACAGMSPEQQQAVQSAAPAEVADLVQACAG
jgi:hypothetical protein